MKGGKSCIVLVIAFLCQSIPISSGQSCNKTVSFVKETRTSLAGPQKIPLYRSSDAPVTEACYNRCVSSTDCKAFELDYDKSSCFRISDLDNSNSTFITKEGVNYFEKICVTLPKNCEKKFWSLERARGFELVGFSQIVIPSVKSDIECAQHCFSNKNFTCKSAQFVKKSENEEGECYLNSEDRRSRPDAYRFSGTYTTYLENQCLGIGENITEECSHEDFNDTTIRFADYQEVGLTLTQCEKKCDEYQNFNCRSLSFDNSVANKTVCILHGDDSNSGGPNIIIPKPGVLYLERVPCLNVQVQCSPDALAVTLHTNLPFHGRMFVQGHYEECNVLGNNSVDTTLHISLDDNSNNNSCGSIKSTGVSNRTLASSVVIVQKNPIIQQKGDRSLKVICILDGDFPTNVTLGTDLTLNFPSNSSGISTFSNSTSVPPVVSLEIIDLNADKPAIVTQLGQNLQLRIKLSPPNSTYGILATHLVASTNDAKETYILLDEKGCPPDPLTFPGLTKANDGTNDLVSNFQAFKFPNSLMVRFNVMVKFCPGECEPVDCGSGRKSFGRRKREMLPNADNSNYKADTIQEVPLQFAIFVNDPTLIDGFQLSQLNNNSNILVLSQDQLIGSVCLYHWAIIALAIGWILIQIILLVVLYFIMRHRFRRKIQKEEERNNLSESDFCSYGDNRHVHWFDMHR